ncbi:hypothetical protein AX16_008542 [Volvariella volvacea WC 439]|nr:hypothetical protein AX16_008542 [Volvariella volvacea WC 439]
MSSSAPRPASTSTRPPISPLPRQPYQVNTQTKVLDSVHGRILCIADIRGRLSALNDLAREHNAQAIIHTGDFGFFEANSLERINDRTLRHLTMYSPLIPSAQRTHLLAPENSPQTIRNTVTIALLSEFPLLLSGQIKLHVPVYTVWGACEDVLVLEKFRLGTYAIDNLHVIDEATTRLLDLGGIKLRLLGLGGALVPHKMFDNGDGNATIAGGQGTMWTTALQIGELVDTAQRVFDQTETRLLVTHASPGREGVISQLALVLKADLTVSAGLHFRYASSYNEFSVQGDYEGFRHKLVVGKQGFDNVWETVKSQVNAVLDEHQRVLLDKFLSVVERLPPAQGTTGPGGATAGEEHAWKNCWNWNLCDAAYGSLVMDIKEGRVSAELKSQGFNFAYRRTATVSATPASATTPLPATGPNAATTAPAAQQGTANATPGASSKPGTGPAGRATPDRQAPPHLANAAKSSTSTPPPPAAAGEASAAAANKDSASTRAESPATAPKTNGTPAPGEKEKPGKKGKKKSQADRGTVSSRGGTPIPPATPGAADGPGPATTGTGAGATGTGEAAGTPASDDVKSPVDGPAGGAGAGARTPKGNKPPRHPWTIFLRMQLAGGVGVSEEEVREFFGDAKGGITKVNILSAIPGRARIAYIEFGDEEAMKAGLAGHNEKFKDTTPEVKRAQDKSQLQGSSSGSGFGGDQQQQQQQALGQGHGAGGGGGRGRGRGRGGAGGGSNFVNRNLTAAGLARGSANGDAGGKTGDA